MDKLKNIERRTLLIYKNRVENSAEHSWHLLISAITLKEYFEQEVDILKSLQMLVIHDIVEIEANDTFVYDNEGYQNQADREEIAAKSIFFKLPKDQAFEFLSLWHEFEAQDTSEAKFAKTIDMINPFIINFYSGGKTWKAYNIKKAQVLKRNSLIADVSPTLWNWLCEQLDVAVSRGYLEE